MNSFDIEFNDILEEAVLAFAFDLVTGRHLKIMDPKLFENLTTLSM